MASVVTQTVVNIFVVNEKIIGKLLTFAFTAHTDGSVADTAVSAANLAKIKGYYISKVGTIPGTPAPQEAYDVTIEDANGFDLLEGRLANRSAASKEIVKPSILSPVIEGASLTLKISGNNVNGAKGTVLVYLSDVPVPGVQEVSVGDVELDSTGLATAAKQPALGTAGTPSTDVMSVQGVNNMTPFNVQGVSGMTPLKIRNSDADFQYGYVKIDNMTPATNLLVSGIADKRLHITLLVILNTHESAGTLLTFHDGNGGGQIWQVFAPANIPIVIPFPQMALRVPTASNGLYVTSSVTATNTYVSAVGYAE